MGVLLGLASEGDKPGFEELAAIVERSFGRVLCRLKDAGLEDREADSGVKSGSKTLKESIIPWRLCRLPSNSASYPPSELLSSTCKADLWSP